MANREDRLPNRRAGRRRRRYRLRRVGLVVAVTVLAAIAGAFVYVVWAATDQSDDGVDVDPFPRLAYRRGTAARIDPGVALTAQTVNVPPVVTVWVRSAGGPWIRKAST